MRYGGWTYGAQRIAFISGTKSFNLGSNPHHQRSIIASLVHGVSVLARGHQDLAPPWWESFNFELVDKLVDDNQSIFGAIFKFKFPASSIFSAIFKFKFPASSIFSAIFKFKFPASSGPNPPRYVVAFRGTIRKRNRTGWKDFKSNLRCIFDTFEKSSRFEAATEAVKIKVSESGPTNVWLAGYSLGSALAMLVAKNIVKTRRVNLKTYLFNPPYISAPFELIKNQKVKDGIRITGNIIKGGLALVVKSVRTRSEEDDPSVVLSSWTPYLFVNPDDPICSEYIGYFEVRGKMDEIGAGKIGRIATQNTFRSLISKALTGRDSEPAKILPSAYLTINRSPSRGLKEAHKIRQWWSTPDTQLQSQLYQFSHASQDGN